MNKKLRRLPRDPGRPRIPGALRRRRASVFRRAIRREVCPRKILLEADFEQPIEEYMPDQPITKAFGGDEPTTRDVIDALDRAAQ